jgi:hypothetical protein
MTKDRTFFQNTMKDIASISPVLESVYIWAQDLGGSAAGLNLSNAWKKCEKALRDYKEIEEVAHTLGYSTLPIALKALGQFKERTPYDVSNLPVTFHKVPKLWLVGRADTRNTPGFAPLTLRSAVREHKQLIPLLLEAWELTDDNGKDVMVKEYLKSSAEDFKQQLYNFIWENEETPLEQQLIDAISREVKSDQFDDWQRKSTLGKK